jgi:hypothetical protein
MRVGCRFAITIPQTTRTLYLPNTPSVPAAVDWQHHFRHPFTLFVADNPIGHHFTAIE